MIGKGVELMWTMILIVVMLLLIFLERKRMINSSESGGAFFLAVASSACMGLCVHEIIRIALSVLAKGLDFSEGDLEGISLPYADRPPALLIAEAVVLFILFVPLAVCFIYILYKTVRVSLDGITADDSQESQKSSSLRCLSLGIALSAAATFMIFASALMTIPYWKNIEYTVQMFNPVVIVFLLIFTAGVALPFLFILAFLTSGPLMMTVSVCVAVCSALYVYSLVLGISSCVKAAKLRAVTVKKATIAGLFMLVFIWNIIPMIYIRSALKKYIQA